MSTPDAARTGALAEAWRSFGRWRRVRPFAGGLCLVCAGLELFLSANLDLGDLQVHLGPQGFLSYLLPIMLVLCGGFAWFTPANRQFYGVIGLLTATYSLIGLNLGGFGVGLLLGIAGGGLTLAWSPGRSGRSPGPPQVTALLVVAALVTGVLVAGVDAPARAASCPVDRGASADPASRPSPSGAPASRTPAPSAPAPSASASSAPAPSASAPGGPPASRPGSGNPIVDAWNGFRDGLEKLFGRNRPPDPPAPTRSGPTRFPPTRSGPTRPGPTPSVPVSPAARPSEPTAGASPGPDDAVPCLGERIHRRSTTAADVPRVAARSGTLRGDVLTMFDATFEGVATVQTADGPLRVLHFTMSRAVTEQFALDVDEAGGSRTAFRSPELTIADHVQFFTPSFTGKLFGLVPLTFTPDLPPPLLLPELRFTDVVITLALVQCGTLTAQLGITA